MYPTSYERMGRVEKVRALVDRFYGLMDERTEYQEIRSLASSGFNPCSGKVIP